MKVDIKYISFSRSLCAASYITHWYGNFQFIEYNTCKEWYHVPQPVLEQEFHDMPIA